jgi:hypothetical protein
MDHESVEQASNIPLPNQVFGVFVFSVTTSGKLEMTKPWLLSSFYPDGKGGHAHDDLREAFFDAIDAMDHWEDGEPEPMVELRNDEVLISQVFRLLLTCTDSLASKAWEWFEGRDIYGGVSSTDTLGNASRFLLEEVVEHLRESTDQTATIKNEDPT